MNSIERRALYNLLRMNWLNDPCMTVQTWQVEDYRSLPFATLFERLKQLDIHLDRTSFVAYADESDSPEELTDHLIGDRQLKADVEDQIYLLVFELWRRLMSEKPSVSIICNELDYQIHAYDSGKLESSTGLQDALANFVLVLDENVDEGVPPKEALQLVSAFCANDIEMFLYDFISEQIDEENDSYAHDLLDDFSAYLEGNKWFDLLRARLIGQSNRKGANKILAQLIEDQLEKNELEFNLELLSFMTEIGDPQTFKTILRFTIPLLQTEEDFQDLLHICIDYFHRLDDESQEQALHRLLQTRANRALNQSFDPKDPDLNILTNG